MPTRRTLIKHAAAAVSATSIAGCASDGTSADTTSYQAIQVQWSDLNRSYRDEILRLSHTPAEGRIDGRYATEFDAAVDLPTITVSDDLHDRLETEFESVQYLAQFCGPAFDEPEDEYDFSDEGCTRIGTVSRSDFNAVQFGDDATVSVSDDRLEVESVEDGGPRDWNYDVTTYSWDEHHADAGQ